MIKSIKTSLIFLLLVSVAACSKKVEEPQEQNLFLENMASQNDDSSYAKAMKVIDFHFPQDHSAHQDFKTEWWYFTGNLAEAGNDFLNKG